MIWNSLLLSNGSIFTFTQPMPTSAIAASSSAAMPPRKIQRQRALRDQRPHDAPVEPGEEILLVLEVAVRRRRRAVPSVSREYFLPQRKMRIDAHGVTMNAIAQREEHRRARADRDRPHVRPHQPAHERHRQHRGDHGERGEDGRVADFAHRFDRDRGPVAASVLRQMKMADDVLDHHDGVIHQDADGEDQREERDAVEREAVEVEDQQRERERGRDGERDDGRFAPAEREQDEQRHADDGDAHVQEQFVGFLRGGLAVVARDGDCDVGGNERAFERLDLAQHLVRDGDGVRARPLGDAERDGGFFVRR